MKIIKKPVVLSEGVYWEDDIDNLIKKGIKHARLITICPKCKERKVLLVPVYNIEKTKNLAQIFIKKGVICKHSFLIFIDKNCVIRSSTLVDYVLE